jgi:DNA-binding NarL/FixJ family response regulator
MDRPRESACLASIALPAALDQLAGPAFVLSSSGHIAELNAAARALLAHRRKTTLRELARATSTNDAAGASVVALGGAGESRGWLVLLRVPVEAADQASRVARLSRRARLTPQQTRVLAVLADGLSNRGIAASLGVSVRTVEAHVCAIFDKLGASSRAGVLAALLAER